MKAYLFVMLFIVGFAIVVYIGTTVSHFIGMGILALFVVLYANGVFKSKKGQ